MRSEEADLRPKRSKGPDLRPERLDLRKQFPFKKGAIALDGQQYPCPAKAGCA